MDHLLLSAWLLCFAAHSQENGEHWVCFPTRSEDSHAGGWCLLFTFQGMQLLLFFSIKDWDYHSVYRLICLLQFCLLWLIFWKKIQTWVVWWRRMLSHAFGTMLVQETKENDFFSEQLHVVAAFLTAGKNVLWLSYWGFHCTSQCINEAAGKASGWCKTEQSVCQERQLPVLYIFVDRYCLTNSWTDLLERSPTSLIWPSLNAGEVFLVFSFYLSSNSWHLF